MRDLGKVKKMLEERRGELSYKNGRIAKGIMHTENELSGNYEDQATERENDEVLDALSESTLKEIHNIDAALMRISEGAYGICVGCGNQVGEKRQEALPYATRCIACA